MSQNVNQCDGCRRGLPLVGGIHTGDGAMPYMGCTADRYAPAPSREAERCHDWCQRPSKCGPNEGCHAYDEFGNRRAPAVSPAVREKLARVLQLVHAENYAIYSELAAEVGCDPLDGWVLVANALLALLALDAPRGDVSEAQMLKAAHAKRLTPYVRHLNDCASRSGMRSGDFACSCGLTAALTVEGTR